MPIPQPKKNEKESDYMGRCMHFLNKDGEPDSKYYVDDKLHFNEEGYRVWGKSIKEELGISNTQTK
jgi:lysophospholipase L1-like esterase